MDTCSTSRWRPLQTVVDLPELRFERLPLFEIALRELHQIVQSGALVVAANRFVQRPPHHLHRVALWRPRRQRVQIDATPRHPMEAPRLEVESPANPYLAVGSRGGKELLFAFRIQQKPTLGLVSSL